MGDFPVGFGRYQLVERLAVGGMAELFVATSPGEHGFQKRVVIKRLLPHLVNDETYNAMFIDEAKLTARLVHPKIAQTFELGKVGDALYIAMEHVDGIDVLALLREYASKRRRVEPHIAAWIAHEVLDALDYAHGIESDGGAALGIVHRDISPSNVLLSVRGDVKLVDFGIARVVDPERVHKSKSGTLKGKYGYMSPEQVIEQGLDARSDLFSVGVVLAEMLTGRRLFAAANELDVLLMVRDAKLTRLDKYGADIEAGLADIVRKALKKPVDERWQSAAAFRDALAEWLFEHRHRVTPKLIADVVDDLHNVVVDRRARSLSGSPPPREAAPTGPAPRPPSEADGAPVIVIEGEPSMPTISVSYDDAAKPGRPIPMSDLASGPVVAPSTRAETVAQRPEARRPPSVGDVPVARVPIRRHATGSDAHAEARRARGAADERPAPAEDGAIEVPIGDTISAAVEAITLAPDAAVDGPVDGSVDVNLDEPPVDRIESTLDRDPSTDSFMRAFDDLASEDSLVRVIDVPVPTPEEALRKRPPTPPALADIAEPPDDAGDFTTTSPLRVLFRLMTARATGLLVVAVGGIKKEIYVRDGQPEYVSSNVANELFGNYLVSKGVLSDGELAMALAMMPHYGGKLGDTLVGLGLLKPLEVFRHLTRQVRSKIIDVCTWNKGSFGWYAGRENPREAFPLDFNAFEILGAGAMALSDELIEAWVAKHADLRLRASRTRRVGPERFEVKGLVAVCDQLDGRRTVGDLVERQPDRDERLRVGRMLCLLEACDLARPA